MYVSAFYVPSETWYFCSDVMCSPHADIFPSNVLIRSRSGVYEGRPTLIIGSLFNMIYLSRDGVDDNVGKFDDLQMVQRGS